MKALIALSLLATAAVGTAEQTPRKAIQIPLQRTQSPKDLVADNLLQALFNQYDLKSSEQSRGGEEGTLQFQGTVPPEKPEPGDQGSDKPTDEPKQPDDKPPSKPDDKPKEEDQEKPEEKPDSHPEDKPSTEPSDKPSTEPEKPTDSPSSNPSIPPLNPTAPFSLASVDSFNFAGQVKLGSEKQILNLAFSTMSPVSLVAAQSCRGCASKNTGFDYSKSTSLAKYSTKEQTIEAERQKIKGVMAHDQLWLADEEPISEFPFLLVSSWNQTKFQEVDGVVSLAKTYIEPSGMMSGSRLLDSLYESRLISDKLFSIHLGKSPVLTFGAIDLSLTASPLTYFQAPPTRRWELAIEGIIATDKSTFADGSRSVYKVPKRSAYLDSFSPYIQLPKSQGPDLFEVFFKDIPNSRISPGVHVGPCDLSVYHPISLFINGFFLRMEPSTFVIDIGLSDKCFIAMRFSENEEWVLGEPFFKNYLAVFDDTRGTVALAPSAESPGSTIIPGEAPSVDLGTYPEDPVEQPENGSSGSTSTNPAPAPTPSSNSIIDFLSKGIISLFGGSSSSPSELSLPLAVAVTIVASTIGVIACIVVVMVFAFWKIGNEGTSQAGVSHEEILQRLSELKALS